MSLRATEHYYHTDEQVRGYLERAQAIVDGLDLDDDLKLPAFVKGVELLAAKHVQLEQVMPGMANMIVPRGQ